MGSEFSVLPDSKPHMAERGSSRSQTSLSMSPEPLLMLRCGSYSSLQRVVTDAPLPMNTSHGCLIPRHCGRVSSGFLSCNCALFLDIHCSSVSHNRPPIKMAPGISTQRYGSTAVDLVSNAGFPARGVTAHKIPALDVRLCRTVGYSCCWSVATWCSICGSASLQLG
jgi:hypothetical protein